MGAQDVAITAQATGARLVTSTSTSRVAVPKTQGGTNPKYVRVAASALLYVRFGGSTIAAANTDTAIQPGDSTVFRVVGFADTADGKIYMAAIAETGTPSVQVTPLEDF